MAITASQITLTQNPNDPDGTQVTFTRSDTGASVTIPVPVQWTGQPSIEFAEVKAAIQQWELQQNGLAAANAAIVNTTI